VSKTALVEDLVAAASDLPVVHAVGMDSQMVLAYARLHQLCAPLFGHLQRLPAPQRGALEVVFGFTRGDPPDAFLLGLSVLSSAVRDGRGPVAARRRR